MQHDTPWNDQSARTIAENVFAAYMRWAKGGTHPQTEQMLLTRLAEAVRPVVPAGAPGEIIDAANAVLDAWEQQNGEGRGPRITALDRANGTVLFDHA